jgi:hypothetical protein
MQHGKVNDLSKKPPVGLLHAFDVASPTVKPLHLDWLRKNIVPYLTPKRSWEPRDRVFIIGLASRTGSEEFNRSLSRLRAQNVEKSLLEVGRASGTGWFHAAAHWCTDQMVALGEEAATFAGAPDGVEDERYRGVVIGVGETPVLKPIGPIKIVRRRSHVQLLSKHETGSVNKIFMDANDKRAENRANVSSSLLAVVSTDAIAHEDFKSLREDWTIIRITLKRTIVNPYNLDKTEWLDVDYEWGDGRYACVERKLAVRDDSGLKPKEMPLDVDQMNTWLNHPYRAWLRWNYYLD